MRRLQLLLSLLLAACGTSDEDAPGNGPGMSGPAVCDLEALAVTLLGPANPCPPDRCVVDSEAGTVECQGEAASRGGQACTRFVIAGDACASPCAPPTCTTDADGVIACTPGCSPDDTTCFAVAADACPASSPGADGAAR